MRCIKCNKQIPLTKNSTKYCSNKCAKLYLKAQYKKRHRDSVNKYNREYRSGLRRGISVGNNTRKFQREGAVEKIGLDDKCYFCNEKTGLEWHHLSYEKPIRVIRLCVCCHRKLHRLLKDRKVQKAKRKEIGGIVKVEGIV